MTQTAGSEESGTVAGTGTFASHSLRREERSTVAATIQPVRRRLANRCGGDRSGNRAIAAAGSAKA